MESSHLNPKIKIEKEKNDNATQANNEREKTERVQAALRPPSSVFTRTAHQSFLGKMRKLRNRNTRVAPIPSRADTTALLASHHPCHPLSV